MGSDTERRWHSCLNSSMEAPPQHTDSEGSGAAPLKFCLKSFRTFYLTHFSYYRENNCRLYIYCTLLTVSHTENVRCTSLFECMHMTRLGFNLQFSQTKPIYFCFIQLQLRPNLSLKLLQCNQRPSGLL